VQGDQGRIIEEEGEMEYQIWLQVDQIYERIFELELPFPIFEREFRFD